MRYPTAVVGEMEGSGLYAAAARRKTNLIGVKSVCDWADGKKHREHQKMATASSMSFCEHVFNDKHALNRI